MSPLKLKITFLFACITALAACSSGDGGGPPLDGGPTPDDCAAGELGCAPIGIPSSGVCNDPDYPIDCPSDDFCWPAGTDCSLEVKHCGTTGSNDELSFRCENETQRYSCCDYQPVLCPADKPFPCPATGVCTETEVCDISSCLDMVGIARACYD